MHVDEKLREKVNPVELALQSLALLRQLCTSMNVKIKTIMYNAR